jgi:beta-glucosidase
VSSVIVYSSSDLLCIDFAVEGAYKEDGRGMTVWDSFSHTPGKVANGENGDVADDHYHLYKEDIRMMKEMGLGSYRFSIAWSRIQPNGEGEINQAGIDHYNAVIDSLVEAGITPFLTLFHWDTPLALEMKYGGWLNADMENHFVTYADICFKHFGDRVKHWLTFNEPLSVALNGYSSGSNAPGRCSDRSQCREGDSSTEPYIVSHNMLNAHGAAVDLYRSKYQKEQDGKIGITLNTDFAYPLTESKEDKDAAQRHMEFQASWYADPVFFGDYPTSMKTRVGDRLPVFTAEQSARLKGSHDFYGINHYTSTYAANKVNEDVPDDQKSFYYDEGTYLTTTNVDGIPIGAQAASPWLYIVPQGMEDILLWVDERYGRPDIYITENGVDLAGESEMTKEEALADAGRIDYYSNYINRALAAKDKGVNLKGYFAWSLMDNFEWADGYAFMFGLTYVDRDETSSTYMQRWQKDSAKWYSNFTKYYPLN